ncbi:hypothetical protein LJR030_002875 [Rhizobium sp. LjRoot30]|uniref:hypothetical protein n=1 Tax=Rhizobium sp. LjRoot30 TaxID=3342320 RepID=UPI003ECF2BB6
MPKKSKNQREAEQRVRQQGVRDNAREARRPSRDDIARMLLWKTISDAHKSGKAGPPFLKEIADDIVDGLTRLGFDDQQSYDVFDELVRKYADGLFPFRPKRHLGRGPEKFTS